MHIKKQKVPPAFLEALSRPFADAEGSQRIPSHVENLRHKLADYYRHSEDTTAEKADAHHYWEQSGQVMKWIGEHIVKSKEYTQSKSKIPKIKFHRHLVAGKVNRLMKDEPLAYVLGSQPFGPLDIYCRKPVLIPRPETEHLFEHFCNLITIAKPTRPLKILDMCTGTGCIALLLDHHLNEAKIRADIIAIDKCDEAVSLASLNQREVLRNRYVEHLVSSGIFKPSVKFKTDPVDYKRAQVKELEKMVQPSTRVAVQQIDVFDDEAMDDLIYRHGPFDVIASNPPYVTAEEWNLLDKNVKDWEDQEALIGDVDGESDGLAFYRRIALLIKQRGLLSSKPASTDMPSLLVEVGHKQAEAVQDILNTTGRFSMIDLIKDPWQKKRGVMAWSRL